MQKQKYKRGNIVENKRRDYNGEKAIIEYSYAEKYGGNDVKSYSIVLLKTGNGIAWLQEEDLLFIEEGGERFFRLAQTRRKRIKKRETDLKWIVKNWKKIRSSPSSDTILFLFDELNLESSFLRNGEFAILCSDWGRWVHTIDYIMTAKDEKEIMAVFKPEASESIKQRILALFKKIRAVAPPHRGGYHGQKEVERDFPGTHPRASRCGKRPVG